MAEDKHRQAAKQLLDEADLKLKHLSQNPYYNYRIVLTIARKSYEMGMMDAFKVVREAKDGKK